MLNKTEDVELCYLDLLALMNIVPSDIAFRKVKTPKSSKIIDFNKRFPKVDIEKILNSSVNDTF